jgi:hypothetical protein
MGEMEMKSIEEAAVTLAAEVEVDQGLEEM